VRYMASLILARRHFLSHFERGKSDLRLINGDELVKLIFQHYEKFESRYKGILPLKRVYVPDPEEAEE